MGKNVTIPLSLLNQIIQLLDQWDLSEYGPAICQNYNNVFCALSRKKQRLALRDAYAKIIQTDDPDDRDEARIHYLREKRLFLEEQFPF